MSVINHCGIYEKAIPFTNWDEYFETVSGLGFGFIDLSVDESEGRLARLDWNKSYINELAKSAERHNTDIKALCLSAHRRYAMGSTDSAVNNRSMEITKKALDLAAALVPISPKQLP